MLGFQVPLRLVRCGGLAGQMVSDGDLGQQHPPMRVIVGKADGPPPVASGRRELRAVERLVPERLQGLEPRPRVHVIPDHLPQQLPIAVGDGLLIQPLGRRLIEHPIAPQALAVQLADHLVDPIAQGDVASPVAGGHEQGLLLAQQHLKVADGLIDLAGLDQAARLGEVSVDLIVVWHERRRPGGGSSGIFRGFNDNDAPDSAPLDDNLRAGPLGQETEGQRNDPIRASVAGDHV